MSVGLVIVAAGRGERCALGYNKVFYPLCGRAVLARCVEAFAQSGLIDRIVLVLSDDDLAVYEALARADAAFQSVSFVARGGATRQESVYHGLCAFDEKPEIVLIHDGARPFVSREIIASVIRDARETGSGVISTRVTDTIKQQTRDGAGLKTLPRDRLYAVQTPQAFRYDEILRAHERAKRDGMNATDDAALYENAGHPITLTRAAGAEENIKLTTPADIARAEGMLAREYRVGTGYDAHRLTEGRRLVLCGVEIPFERGLLGHSDADVAAHALMDALLGAMALGDIGRHFPDNDPQYKDISSMRLLGLVAEMMRENGMQLINADVTIVAQKPKLAPYRDEMRENIARALNVSVRKINVKATTTEGMGFEGEGRGISAQATALIR